MTGRDAIDLKFSHARDRLHGLAADIQAFLELDENRFRYDEVEEDNGDLTFRMTYVPTAPLSWALPIGEAIHSARSALDHLACQLVEGAGGRVSHAQFPVGEAENGFGENLRKSFPRVSSELRQEVKALRPWRGGDDLLYQLHALDILDKHRLILPVAAAPKGLGYPNFGFVVRGARDAGDYPLRVGDEVGRIMKAARTVETELPEEFEDDLWSLQHPVPVFEFVFGHDTVAAGEPVLEHALKLVDHAAAVVEPLVERVV